MSAFARITGRIYAIGADPGDSPDVAFRKGILVLASTIITLLSVLWVWVYATLGLWAAASIPLAYMVVTLVDLGILARTRRYAPFLYVQLGMWLVLPFPLQWVLGGFVASSAISMWAFVAALGAIFFTERTPIGWFLMFSAGTVVSALLEPTLTTRAAPIPDAIRTTFFAVNIVTIAGVAWSVTRYFVQQRTLALRQLDAEHAKSEALLLNVLPQPIAERLKAGEELIADAHADVTVLFADIVGFTPLAMRTPPRELVDLLNRVFSAFDELVERYRLEKIKTIGDAYLVVGGLPEARADHADAVANLALDMLDAVAGLDGAPVTLRIGIDTGPVTAGVIGRRKFAYDLWGEAVNTASRMQSNGLPGRIQVTPRVEALLHDRFRFEPRGPIDVKGIGPMHVFLLVGRVAPPSPPIRLG